MKKYKVFESVGWIVGVTALALSYVWFGWKLVVILIIAFWGRNLERKSLDEAKIELENQTHKQQSQGQYKSVAKSKFQTKIRGRSEQKKQLIFYTKY